MNEQQASEFPPPGYTHRCAWETWWHPATLAAVGHTCHCNSHRTGPHPIKTPIGWALWKAGQIAHRAALFGSYPPQSQEGRSEP